MSLPALDGLEYVNQPYPLKEGQPVVIECFATWCPPCRGQIPHLAKMPELYPNVCLIAVSQEEKSVVEGFLNRMPPMKKYNVAVDPGSTASTLMDENGAKGFPAAFMFDKTGKMVWTGAPSAPEFDEHMKLLNEA